MGISRDKETVGSLENPVIDTFTRLLKRRAPPTIRVFTRFNQLLQLDQIAVLDRVMNTS